MTAIQCNPLSLAQIRLRRYGIGRLKNRKDRKVHGWDTETLNGYARLLCSDDGRSTVAQDLDSFLGHLTAKAYRASYNFFFNLRYDVQAILKYLPRDKLLELYETKNTDWEETQIFYIPEKMFKLKKKKHVSTFYDVAQFFEGSLDTCSKKYLGAGKETQGLDRADLGSNPETWRTRLNDIVQYCIVDAQLTKGLGDILNTTVRDKIGLRPNKYTSKARLAKDYFRSCCHLPDIRNIPKWALSMGLASYSGGRFEMLKKGHFRHAYSVDIASAYPYEMANLVDVERGTWTKCREMDPEALIGFYLCKVDIPLQPLGPLPYRMAGGTICYPVGSWYQYVSKRELEMYSQTCDFQVIRGVEYHDREPIYPLRDRILDLYALKKSTPKDRFEYDLYKITMNSLYGSFYEKVKDGDTYRAGLLFNPIYASSITAGTRTQIWDVVRRQPRHVIGIATDGIILDHDPEMSYSKELGQWALDAQGDTVVIRSGIYQIAGKVKNRGLSKVRHLKTPYGQYADLFTYIQANPSLTQYPVTIDRPLNLGECLRHIHKYSPDNINVWTQYDYVIDINQDHKRVWMEPFKAGGELFTKSIDSLPILIQQDGAFAPTLGDSGQGGSGG